jgi:transcriptional regulator EpsA
VETFEEIADESRVRSRSELDMVLVNIETAVRVRKKPDFFSWVQGVFQAMVPHEVLVCGLAVPPTQSLRFEWLGSFPMPEDRFSDICRPGHGVMQPLITLWQGGGCVPLVLSPTRPSNASPLAGSVVGELAKLQLGNVAAHGLLGLDGPPACFFAFFKLRAEAGEAQSRTLDLLLPYLYAAWLRANVEESNPSGPHPSAPAILTSREMEILHWVERGKSNNEIAQILNISHLTVKNHVQKILRKLNVQNRAQAVAKGISLNLSRSHAGGY